MAGRLSFSIAINLLTENFKKGTSSVKNGFRAMQMQVLTFAAALGAGGLGLSSFVSKLIEVARVASRVTTALKNVSGSTAQYVQNQKFVNDMAKKYGLEVNSLTSNFAKFTASATQASMSMADQKKIFESVSRANTAFGLSVDESNGVFLALSQMMGKGKISSEELRKQMGEKLPVALQAMAKAAGTSVAGLEKLMKQGKLMSADVLPKFADALNAMLPDVNTDNIETSLARLQNAFGEFVNGTGVQSGYKKLIDSLTKAVQYAAENIKKITNNLVAVLIGVSLGKFFKWVILEVSKAQRAAMIAASNAAKATGVAFDQAAWKAKSASATMQMAWVRSLAAVKAAFTTFLPTAIFTIIAMIIAKIVNLRNEAKRVRDIFSDYKKEAAQNIMTDEIKKLQSQLSIMNDKNETQRNINSAQSELQRMLGVEGKTQKEINGLVAKRIELLKAAAEADFYASKSTEFTDKNRGLSSKIGLDEDQMSVLAGLRDSYNKTGAVSDRNAYYSAVGAAYRDKGVKGKYDIDAANIAIDEYIQNTRVIIDADSYLKNAQIKANNLTSGASTPLGDDSDTKKTPLQKAEEKYAKAIEELELQRKNEAITVKEYNESLAKINEDSFKELAGLLTPEAAEKNETFQKAKAGTSTEFQKIEKGYLDSLQVASDQHAVNALTDGEYTDAKIKLTEKVINEMASVENMTDVNYDFLNERAKELKQLRDQAKIDKIQKDYADSLQNLTNQREAGFLSEEQYEGKLGELITSTLELSASLLGAKAQTDKFYKGLAAQHKPTSNKSVKTDFQFNKEADDILSSSKSAEEAYKRLKLSGRQTAEELVKEIDKALANSKTLPEALKLAEAKQAVKELNKELAKTAYNGLEDAVSNIDGVVNAIERMRVAFEEGGSDWEKFVAMFDTTTRIVDAILSVIEMTRNMTEIIKMLGLAKKTEAAIDTAVTATKIANITAGTTAEVTATAVTKSTAATEVAANTAAAASGAAKSVAGVPLIGVALAGAAVGAILAMMLKLPKFAGGGIVSGSPHGDLNLARVNGGEMIMNSRQQRHLWDVINGGSVGRSSYNDVKFTIEGDKLVGAISNYNRKQGRIR